ncbi:MAG TPA: DUF362 domain-containing protein [Clostridia bacterium]|nr:MAG: 2-ketoisovalerate ferredoxin oxidoreductase subunit delta [Firmicutes bacterium ADurb.Bin146]HOD93950.1 DUF362 domain-containing protein [Clostridia bacterium]HQM40066.1 DUF362 domain-containing protein [Clostridia bacterium]
MASKVYFTNMNTGHGQNLLTKFEKLIIKAGIDNISFENKFTAIKVHFGEPGNLAYIRPNYAKVLCDHVKKQKGRPFLTDCNTLYPGKRKNALEHLDTAYQNGFNPFVTGCNVIIGDGLKGTDETLIKIDMKHVKEAKIGHAIADSDIIISLNHFKGHVATGIGGAIKNIGMGCGSRAGKMEMHSAGKPIVIESKCRGCLTCFKSCAQNAIYEIDGKAYIDQSLCAGCGRCIGSCLFDAISAANDETNEILSEKIAEYTYAVLKNKLHFHISFVMDISPYCDCHNFNDLPIVDDIGIFASADPVALDKACADSVNRGRIIQGSLLDRNNKKIDYITTVNPKTNWMHSLEYASKIGLGNLEYEIINLDK